MLPGQTLREEYERTGMLRQTLPLADPSVIPALVDDLEVFRRALAAFERRGVRRRVPYLLTDAIRRVSFDASIRAAVSAVLGEEPWVMWGPNIREDVPNQAGNWHVDCESIRWPTLTVVVGLDGCHGGNATRCIPGSQRLHRHPPPLPSHETGALLADARALDSRCDRIATFDGFGNGRFYVFDAAGWHAGDPAASRGRKLLFLHYQRAAEPRIPYMRDYVARTWFDYPAEYLSSNGSENRTVYQAPEGDSVRRTVKGMLYRLRYGSERAASAH